MVGIHFVCPTIGLSWCMQKPDGMVGWRGGGDAEQTRRGMALFGNN